LSHAHRDGKTQAYVPIEHLLDHATSDLVIIQPMRGLIRHGSKEAIRQRYAFFAKHFKGRFYLALSRHMSASEDHWLEPTMGLAKDLSIPCLLSQDTFFHAPERKDVSDLVQAIRTNLTLDDAVAHMFVNCERSLHSLLGIAQRFGALPCYEAALRSSQDLYNSFSFDMSELRYRYPKEMIPESHTAQSFLEELTWQEAGTRYGTPLPQRVRELLVHELALIETLGFADYFLTVWDIVRWARERNIVCQGRGSAANSAVCFVLGITAVDPLKFDLLFERFVSVERGDPPDIDVDFEHERREEVIQYIYERYGRQRAAMVANVITFRTKGAMRAVGKALGISEEILTQVSRQIEEDGFRRYVAKNVTPPKSESEALVEIPQAGVSWRLWREMAAKIKGFPRHLGIHSGGFMLADKTLDHLVPVEPATMVGRSVIQWCKDDIEGLGFFKIDILALGMLTAVRKSFEAIAAHYGKSWALATIPQEDPATYQMIQKAETVGTFQIESRAQMSMLPRLKPRTFYDLVVEVAIIRPGPIQGGMVHPYLRRRDGVEPVSFPDERLRSILERTLGIPLFQEQVMRIAMAVGGFSPGEANELRRHMGAWSIKGHMGPWLERLAKGMRGNGINEDFVQGILGQMRGFAHYGFPESHAVSFALIAYASAWLKCHYPAAFFMAVLNSQPMGFYAPYALVQAAQRDGVPVLPVCVNHSHWDATLERVSSLDQEPCYAIRLGFRLIAGLSRRAAHEIEQKRATLSEGFQSFEHFVQSVSLYRPDLTSLAAANAFRVFGLERKAALWCAEAAPFCPVLEDVEDPVVFRPESNMESIQQDLSATTTTLGSHPSAVIRQELWCYDVPLKDISFGRDLSHMSPGIFVHVFGMVLVRQSPPSAKGMVFLTLEDETGFINLALTPQMYTRYSKIVENQAFLCVRGKLQKQHEAHSILVAQFYEPKLRRADVIPLVSRSHQRHVATPRISLAINYE
jgi:error-prone DNA polymerase